MRNLVFHVDLYVQRQIVNEKIVHFQLLNNFPIDLEHCVKNEKIEENVLFRLVKTPGKNSNRNNVSGHETSKKSAGGRYLPCKCYALRLVKRVSSFELNKLINVKSQ